MKWASRRSSLSWKWVITIPYWSPDFMWKIDNLLFMIKCYGAWSALEPLTFRAILASLHIVGTLAHSVFKTFIISDFQGVNPSNIAVVEDRHSPRNHCWNHSRRTVSLCLTTLRESWNNCRRHCARSQSQKAVIPPSSLCLTTVFRIFITS